MFVTEGNATRVQCPHCRAISNLSGAAANPGVRPGRTNIVLDHRPNYSIEEASRVAKQQLAEAASDPNNGWELISVNYERIISCYSKSYCLDKEKNEVFCTKGTAHINGDPQTIMDVYWSVDQELNWNASTVQTITVVSQQDHPVLQQLVYQTHKTTSAATLKNDACILKVRDPKGIDGDLWSFAVSQFTDPETKANFRRGWLVFGGLHIQPTQNNVCEVSLVWCWDFNGWTHEKFVLEEKKRAALRLSKIAAQVSVYAPPRKVNVQPNPTQPTSSTVQPSSSQTSAQVPASKKPQPVEGTLRGCKECRLPETGNYCSRCGNPTGSVCGRCYSTTLYSGDNCNNCGNKLRDPTPSQ